MDEGAFGHHVVVFFIELSVTANVKQNLLTSNWEVMKHTLTGKAIGAQTISAVWLLFVLVKINVNYLCVVFFLYTYILQIKPVKHMGW